MFKPLFGTPLNRDHPLSRGLVGCWLFNEGTGKFVWDATGNGNNGALTTMADPATSTSGWGPGLGGGALLFDGANDYVNLATIRSLNLVANYSYVAQVKTTAASNQGVFQQSDGSNHISALHISNTGTVQLITYESGYGVVSSTVSIADGVHHQIAGTKSDTSGVIYIDGATNNSGTVKNVLTPITEASIGVREGGNYFMNGTIEYVFIYNRALSADEIAYLYAFPYCMFEDESSWWMAPPAAVLAQLAYAAYLDGRVTTAGASEGLVTTTAISNGAVTTAVALDEA